MSHTTQETAQRNHLTELYNELDSLRGLVRSLAGQGPATARTHEAVVQMTNEALQKIQDAQQSLPGIGTYEIHLARQADHFEEERDEARRRYYDAVGPIMIDSLLKYIANDEDKRHVLNYTYAPARRPYAHYPTPQYIKDLVTDHRLNPTLSILLLHALKQSGTQGHYQGHMERNSCAHPTGSNGKFTRAAHNLETLCPGWRDACHEFVLSKKGQAADRLSTEFPVWEDPQKVYEAVLWDPSRRQGQSTAHNGLLTGGHTGGQHFNQNGLPSAGWASVEVTHPRARVENDYQPARDINRAYKAWRLEKGFRFG